MKALIIQFVKFGFVGVTNTAVFYACYLILLNFTGYHIAYLIGFAVSVINAYVLSSKFVFKNKDENITKPKSTKKKLVKIYISYGVTTIIGLLFVSFLVEVLRVSEKVAPLFSLCLTIPLNFGLNKFWVFKEL